MRMYIDDIRDPKGDFEIIARSSKDAIYMINQLGCPDFISFDHDLGGDDTAMAVAKYIVEKDLDFNGCYIPLGFDFFVHSANPVGAANIAGYIRSYLRQRD